MKNVIIGIFLLAFIATGNSQILLDEAKVDYKKATMKLDPITQTLVVKIPEKKVGEFEKDPLTFMKNKFDLDGFLKANEGELYSGFQINLVSKKGQLIAMFDNQGELISSKQRFKNKRLPHDVQVELVKLYNGAVVEKTKSFANSKGWDITKEYYKIKLNDGDRTRRVRIDRKDSDLSIAGL